MELIKQETHLDFLGKRRISLAVSGALILLALIAYFLQGGLNYGIDFRGGTLIQIQLQQRTDIGALRTALAEANIGAFALQAFGDAANNEFLITLGEADQTTGQASGKSPAQRAGNLLKERFPNLAVRRVESVGPKVGEELKLAAFEAILFSLVAILLYIWLRFQWRFSAGALLALFHDVLIVLAVFVFTQREITLIVVAAVLTTAGYSINDTIVIMDRIRENVRRFQKKDPLDIYNESINQTLSRTVLTSGTTLMVLLAMFFFGGEIIHDFAMALIVGVVVGTYSSIFIAAPMAYDLQKWFPPRAR